MDDKYIIKDTNKLEQHKMPWGYYVQHILRNEYQVKEICLIEKGSCFSYHYHSLVDEIWFIKKGEVHAKIGQRECDYCEGALFLIPKGTYHRLYNIGMSPAVILEIQIGKIDNDDVHRLEDIYGRADCRIDSQNKRECIRETEEISDLLSIKANARNNKHENSRWINFFDIVNSSNYRIRKIEMLSNTRFSYHYHMNVDEVWLITEGKLYVEIDDCSSVVQEGDIIHIPRGAKHFIKNRHTGMTKIIEIQNGTDPNILKDIVRLKL